MSGARIDSERVQASVRFVTGSQFSEEHASKVAGIVSGILRDEIGAGRSVHISVTVVDVTQRQHGPFNSWN
jgi:hypothetical protein